MEDDARGLLKPSPLDEPAPFSLVLMGFEGIPSAADESDEGWRPCRLRSTPPEAGRRRIRGIPLGSFASRLIRRERAGRGAGYDGSYDASYLERALARAARRWGRGPL